MEYWRHLKAFFAWTVSQKVQDTNPVDKLSRPRKPERKVVYIRPQELATLLETAGPWLGPIIRFAATTGLRLGEICALRWRHVDLDAGRIIVEESEGFRPKASAHAVPIVPEARAVLEEVAFRHASEFGAAPHRDLLVFTSERTGGKIHGPHLSRRFKRLVRSCGLSEEYSFHTLRHTFASNAVMRGVDLFRVSKWLGHASVTTTEIYAHFAPEYGAQDAFSWTVLGATAEARADDMP